MHSAVKAFQFSLQALSPGIWRPVVAAFTTEWSGLGQKGGEILL